jgi:hypothetical protein
MLNKETVLQLSVVCFIILHLHAEMGAHSGWKWNFAPNPAYMIRLRTHIKT